MLKFQKFQNFKHFSFGISYYRNRLCGLPELLKSGSHTICTYSWNMTKPPVHHIDFVTFREKNGIIILSHATFSSYEDTTIIWFHTESWLSLRRKLVALCATSVNYHLRSQTAGLQGSLLGRSRAYSLICGSANIVLYAYNYNLICDLSVRYRL